jgi:hypothetical protein
VWYPRGGRAVLLSVASPTICEVGFLICNDLTR